MKMTQRHKDFILNRLIPAIVRENGRGFGMSWWMDYPTPGELFLSSDDIQRRVPSCGTVCCIGGTVQMLCGKRYSDKVTAGARIGLDERRAGTLFYGWKGESETGCHGAWPDKYVDAYAKAKTCRGKAGVACRLLREVVKTEGACLDQQI